ncbi:MAG: UPF0182 family protein, partial [Acidobacteriota bacterium]
CRGNCSDSLDSDFDVPQQFGRRRWIIPAVLLAFFLLVLWPAIAGFYTTLLWFSQLGYSQVFTTTLATKLWLAAASGIISIAVLLINLRIARRFCPELPLPEGYFEIEGERIAAPSFARIVARLAIPVAFVVGLLFTTSGWGLWETYLRFRNQVPFGKVDAVFGRDIAFYVFTLPMLEAVVDWLLTLLLIALVSSVLVYATRAIEELSKKRFKLTLGIGARNHLLILGALVLVVFAYENYLKIPGLLFSDAGVIAGATYTDLNLRLPIYRIEVVAALGAALLAIASCFRQKAQLLWIGLAINIIVVLLGAVLPPIYQRLSVAPNELAKETPYIERNIAATRHAFALDGIEERELGGDSVLTAQDIQENRRTINNIRLWDQKPLLDTFAQIQEFRTYYEFKSVDNDRYTIDGAPQQVMLSARELSAASLPNRNWINERLTFTHGYGLTLGPVDQVTPEGLPVLTVKDIPPASTVPSLKVTRPEIYFGELTDDYVYVRTKSKEFDYPEGEQNVFTTYQGNGGIDIGTYWRRILFATRLGDSKLLLSDDLTPESRVMLHRNIRERLMLIAPFLTYDTDPYMVISQEKLFWIVDGYTTSDRYPYSQPTGRGINYIRNSVKAVIDAYHGSVQLYIADEQDPLIQTYARIFPGMFKPMSEMSADLRLHLRYPEDIFRIQTAVYSTYHMDSPQVFYNKEDQWSVAAMAESSEQQDAQNIDPYYTIMKLPSATTEEFLLMLPFTPRSKDNLASWMVARSDAEHYGKLAVYRFPKQKLVYGPKQVLVRINQDPEISRQLTLWNQRGSRAVFGTLLVIPIKESLLYIQPLYLSAESGKIPELRRVIVVAENQIAMEPTLQASLNRLFGDGAMQMREQGGKAEAPVVAAPGPPESQKLVEEAKQSYDRAMEELKRLRQVLDQISRPKQ